MASTFAVLRGNLSSSIASPDTDFTSSGFGTPKAALVLLCRANGTNNPADSLNVSVGFFDGTNTRGAGIVSADNLANSNSTRQQSTTHVAKLMDPSAGTEADWSAAFITDGVRLTMTTDATTVAYIATVILFGGADTSAAVGTFTPNGTQNLTASITGLSFAPDAIFFLTIGASGTTNESFGNISFGIAVDDGSLTQRAAQINSNDALGTSDTSSRLLNNRVGGQMAATTTWQAELTAWTSDGATLTTRDAATGGDIMYYLALAFSGGSFDLRTLSTSTSVTTVETSVGFTPAFLMAASTLVTAANTQTDHVGLSIGATNGTTTSAIAVRDEDNQDTSDSSSSSQQNVVHLLDPTDGTDDVVATLSAFGSSSYTLNYTTVLASATLGWILAIGTAAAGRTTRNTDPYHHGVNYGTSFIMPSGYGS